MSVAGVAEASGFPLNFWLTKKFGKQRCGIILAPVMIIGLVLNLFVSSSQSVGYTVLLFTAVIVYYFGYSGVGFVATTIQPDVTDVDELITGRRREGMIGTFNLMIKKTISGFMSAFTGFILSGFGFATGEGTLNQTASGIFGLRITYIFLPVLFVILSYRSIRRYKMNKEEHELIMATIAEKKEKGAAELSHDDKRTLEEIAGVKFEDMWIGGGSVLS